MSNPNPFKDASKAATSSKSEGDAQGEKQQDTTATTSATTGCGTTAAATNNLCTVPSPSSGSGTKFSFGFTSSTAPDDPSAPAFHMGSSSVTGGSVKKGRRILRARRPPSSNEATSDAEMGDVFKRKRTETDTTTEEEKKVHGISNEQRAAEARNNSLSAQADDDDDDDDYVDDDEDCDCSRCREDRAEERYGDEDSYDGDDFEDDDDDHGENPGCTCPNCRARRMISNQMLMNMYRSMTGMHQPICGNGNDDEDEESEEESDEDETVDGARQQPCAVCFSSKNPLVQLPCCGGGARELDSTTRFCQKCIYKCLSKSGGYHGGCHVGECPRCRTLITVENRRTSAPECATTEQMCAYAEDNESSLMGVMLLAAYGEARYLPIELLEDDKEKAHKLVQWGILKTRKDGQVYCLDRAKQKELRKHIEHEFLADSSQHDEDDPLCRCESCTIRAKTGSKLMIAVKHLEAALSTAWKLKVLTTLRLLNRAAFVLLRTRDYLKADLEPWQEVFVACLNLFLSCFTIFLITLAIMAILIAILTVAVAWLTIKATGWVIDSPKFLQFMVVAYFGSVTFVYCIS
jgi:hypothetical protein